MKPIERPWGLEHILECTPEVISVKLEIGNGKHAQREYQNVKQGSLEVVKGGLSIRAYGTKQTWETFKQLNTGEVYHIYNDSKYTLMAIGDTEVIETKVPDLRNLLDKIKKEGFD